MIFQTRKNAGELLAKKLFKYKSKNTLVLALPRGGVPVASEIAQSLSAPLNVLIVRKIGAPFNSELAVGAVCENEEPILNNLTLSQVGADPDDIKNIIKNEKIEVNRQIDLFRKGKQLGDLTEYTVIVVDDGLATGATMKAAVKYLKRKGVKKIIVAVPVTSANTARMLRPKVDELVALNEPEDLYSVGQWYRDFTQVTDREVISMLNINNNTGVFQSVPVEISIGNGSGHGKLIGELTAAKDMKGLIIFTHGSGSSHRSTRNRAVAKVLNKSGFGTLLFDLLTEEEESNRKNVFDINLLSKRLQIVTRWAQEQPQCADCSIGYFGASTGAAAALRAVADMSDTSKVFAIVSRGGRPDLAGEALKRVKTPTLLIVGGNDFGVIELNQQAQQQLINSKLSIVQKATHLFEEPGALEEVSRQATKWFSICIKKIQPQPVERLSEEQSEVKYV